MLRDILIPASSALAPRRRCPEGMWAEGARVMPEIEIYTQPWCPFCARALNL